MLDLGHAWRRFVRLPVAILYAALLLPTLWQTGDSARASENPQWSVAIFDSDPDHLWNRLYAALWLREDTRGTRYGNDTLDPPLWLESENLLSQPSHSRALHALDAFLQTHAENLIHDPLKRAIFQRDLWTVFYWSVQQTSASGRPKYDRQKRELQIRLAEVLRRLALSRSQIEALPDNYAQAVSSGGFAKQYDPRYRERPFLPPDLFDGIGPWVFLDNYVNPEPVAASHIASFSGRSSFLIFLRLPGGRKATVDYVRALWNFPEPWVHGEFGHDEVDSNPKLPAFPAGTEVALVREMNLFDDQGELVAAPITESVQIRVYREITQTPAHYVSGNVGDMLRNSGQDFFQFTLSRHLLFLNTSGGLRARGWGERTISVCTKRGRPDRSIGGRLRTTKHMGSCAPSLPQLPLWRRHSFFEFP